jgi:hypothetical protein
MMYKLRRKPLVPDCEDKIDIPTDAIGVTIIRIKALEKLYEIVWLEPDRTYAGMMPED